MHLALTLNPFVDSDLLYAQQMGIDWIVGDVPAWDTSTLAAACNRVVQSGLFLSAFACLPAPLVDRALRQSPDNETAVAEVCRIITDAGKLGIPLLEYRWPLADAGSAARPISGRGGSLGSVYRPRHTGERAWPEGREGMWQALSRFLRQVVPVAEAAHVRLAYQTDVSMAFRPDEERILSSVAELDRLQEVAGSPWHGLDIDHGVVALAAGQDAPEVIRHFGRQRSIFAARMRNLRSTDDGAQEAYLDEDKAATLRALVAYRDAGFDGPIYAVPSPGMTDDTQWRHKVQAFYVGYLRGLLQVIG